MTQTLLDQRVLGVGTALDDHTITASDVISFADVGASNAIKKDTVQGVLDLAGGGAWNFITSVTTSAGASFEFKHGTNNVVLDSTYALYEIVITNIFTSVDNRTMLMYASTDTGSSYTALTYAYHEIIVDSSSGSYNGTTTNTDRIECGRAFGNQTGEAGFLRMTLADPSNTSKYKIVDFTGGQYNSNTHYQANMGGAVIKTNSAVDAVKFNPESGNITCFAALYGLSKT